MRFGWRCLSQRDRVLLSYGRVVHLFFRADEWSRTMDSHLKQQQRNNLLKEQRLLRGWSQAQAAEELSRLCEDKPRSRENGEINDKMIGRWERGEHLPSLYYQRKLGLLYERSLQELGFIITRETRNDRAKEPIPTSDR